MIQPNWNKKNVQAFWGEIAPCNHLLQIYENDAIFLNSLEGFAGSGFLAGETVIIIATPGHILALNSRLAEQGFDIEKLKATDKYICAEAEDTLSRFMVNGWPDAEKFNQVTSALVARATKHGRKVRAFGEMVALLWEKGHSGATVHLEELWSKYVKQENISLFCAYPKAGFTNDPTNSLKHICASHSKIISGLPSPTSEVMYRDIVMSPDAVKDQKTI